MPKSSGTLSVIVYAGRGGYDTCAARLSIVDISTMVISTVKLRAAPAEDFEVAPVTPAVFQILIALAGGESDGYGIMQDVERFAGQSGRLGAGTLYRSIQRMLVSGMIEELDVALDSETDDDR